MKIYQLHEYRSNWDDYDDYIIGSYLRKERAEEEKVKAEAQENELVEQDKKCEECPCLYDAYINNDELLSYCLKAKLEKDEFSDDMDCDNYYQHLYGATFKIIEVEVEE